VQAETEENDQDRGPRSEGKGAKTPRPGVSRRSCFGISTSEKSKLARMVRKKRKRKAGRRVDGGRLKAEESPPESFDLGKGEKSERPESKLRGTGFAKKGKEGDRSGRSETIHARGGKRTPLDLLLERRNPVS